MATKPTENKTEPKAPSPRGLIGMLFHLVPEPYGVVVGSFLGLGAFMAVVVAIPVVLKAIPNFIAAKSQVKVQECWELKEVQTKLFRFNRCTGEALPVIVPNPAGAASAALPASASKTQ